MRTVRNFAFVLLTLSFIVAAERGVFAESWQQWGTAHGCSLFEWTGPWLDGWCDCGGGMGCAGDDGFCDSFAGACDNFCFTYSCGYAEVTGCAPDLVGWVECHCDYCN